jgi:hypothetical protein
MRSPVLRWAGPASGDPSRRCVAEVLEGFERECLWEDLAERLEDDFCESFDAGLDARFGVPELLDAGPDEAAGNEGEEKLP